MREIEVEGSSLVIALRPHVKKFLSSLATHYELVVWTAGIESYGRAVVQMLDPSGSFISHILYMQHCTRKDNHFIKDLNRLGRDDVRLLDKNPVSYFLQPSKGISVKKFLGDPQDVELLRLLNDLRPGLEIIDISFEAPQPAFSLSLDIPADQSLDVEAAPEGFDDDSSVEILVALFGNLRIDDGFDETVSTMSESEVDEAAKEVGHESDSFGAHDDPCCVVASVYHVHNENACSVSVHQEQELEPSHDLRFDDGEIVAFPEGFDFDDVPKSELEPARSLDSLAPADVLDFQDLVPPKQMKSQKSESEVDEAAKEVGHESDSFGAHHDPCCFVASVYHVHQEQVQQGDIKNLEPQEDIASKTTRPRRSRVSNCGPLRRSARLAQKYPRRSPRLAAKRLAAKP
jgi:hypothetical protein